MRPLCCILAAAAILSRPAQGAWLPDGTPVCSVDSPQFAPVAISDGAGGVLVAWLDERNGNRDVFAQRLDALGTPAPRWPAEGLAVCTAPGGQGYPRIATDGAGGAMIAWEDVGSGLPEFYMARITGDGAVAPGWTPGGVRVVENSTYCPLGFFGFQVVADDRGGVNVCYSPYYTTGGHDCPTCGARIVTRHITGAGLQDWQLTYYEVGCIYGPYAAADGAGGVFFAWHAPPVSPVKAIRFTRDGQVGAGWPTLATDIGVTTDVVAPDGLGGAYFHFLNWVGPSFDNQPWLQHLAPDGTRVAGWPADGLPAGLASSNARLGVVVADGAGGAVVCWQDRRAADFDLYAQRMGANGTRAAGWPETGAAVCLAPGDQETPSMEPDGLGGAWLAWEDRRSGAPAVYALRLSGSGTPASGWPPGGQRISPSPASPPNLAVSDPNTALLVWADSRVPGGSRVYAQRLESDGPVAVLIALTVAAASPRLVRIVGHVADASHVALFLDRRDGGGSWMELASVSVDAGGRFGYDDRAVMPGQLLSYRLRVAGTEGVTLSSEVSVAVPEAPSFALHPIRPIPSGPRIIAAFSLPDARPTRLEVLDLGGRRIFAREVGSLGPGEHVLEVSSPTPAPGVYWVRLTRGVESAAVRTCIVR